MIEMTLPWPPSVNSYWRHPTRGALAGRHLISEEGRRYRNLVAQTVLVNRTRNKLLGRLAVRIDAYPPDRRRRDLDNILKALLDALTHAGVMEDDSQIDDLHIVRKPLKPNGEIFLTILESENT
jgi:crossover junction endodeoxyribonuclease RusA